MRAMLGVLLGVGLCGCATVQQTMASHPWYELKTQHFRILTDADQKKAVRSAIELERYRRAMLLLWSADANPEEVTWVLMVRDLPELFEYAGGSRAGFFRDFGARTVFVFSADQISGVDSRDVLEHELAHMVTHLVTPRPPHWVAEGLSKYLETTRISDEGEVAFGKPNRLSMDWLTNVGLMDLDRLWTWNPSDRGEIGQYYAAAWALMHYLITERPQHFAAMMRELSKGHDGRSAWRAAFGDTPLSGYWQAVRDYLARGRWQLLTHPLPAVPEAVNVRRMSPGEAHAALAWLEAVGAREKPMAARAAAVARELDLAEKMDPTSALVKDTAVWRTLMNHVAEVEAREVATKKAPAVCPADVANDQPLSPGPWVPRTMTTGFDAEMLRQIDPGPRSVSYVQEFYLAAGDVQIASGAPGGVPALFVLRRAGPAGCVVNGWRDETSQASALWLASWWEAKDRSHLLLLFASRSQPSDDDSQLRWMALATDGKRAWWAARGADGSPVLSGKEPRLRRAGGKLTLELAGPAGGTSTSYPLEIASELGPAGKRAKEPGKP